MDRETLVGCVDHAACQALSVLIVEMVSVKFIFQSPSPIADMGT